MTDNKFEVIDKDKEKLRNKYEKLEKKYYNLVGVVIAETLVLIIAIASLYLG